MMNGDLDTRFGEVDSTTTQVYNMFEDLPVWGFSNGVGASGRQPAFDFNQGNDNSITSGKIYFFCREIILQGWSFDKYYQEI